jgi:acetylornithine deacetylase
MITEVIGALEERYIPRLTAEHPLTGKAQCSINLIRGGTQINIIPEHCEIHVDRRLVPGEDPDTVIPAVERILDELRAGNPNLAVVQEAPDMVDSPLDPTGGREFGAFVASVLKSTGLPDGLTGVGYGTDASSFSRVGIPAVVLGPGDIAQAHTAGEWIDLGQLNSGVDVYQNLMMSKAPMDS